MTINHFNLNNTHPSWRPGLEQALKQLNPTYLTSLAQSSDWLPGPQNIFNAFSLPVTAVNYVLFGESPYPRQESANGYAFWDNAVQELWSPTGLSKRVNRATSLRNILKMLLIAEGLLTPDQTSQMAIAQLNKQGLIQTNQELFTHLLDHGFLLLNATPVLRPLSPPKQDAIAWAPFMQTILNFLLEQRPQVQFLLLGQIANTIDQLLAHHPDLHKIYAEHPYNLSFISNDSMLHFFKPLHLLRKTLIDEKPSHLLKIVKKDKVI